MGTSVPQTENAGERVQAVSELFREHNRTLVRFLQSKLQNEHEAREIAQEAYVRLLELGQTGAISFLRSYLFRIASNLAIDRIRSRSVHNRIDGALLESVEDLVDSCAPERTVFAAEDMRIFWASLQELSEHHRQAFVMSRLQGVSTARISRQLGKSERMIRRYIVHALIYCRHRVAGLSQLQATQRMDMEAPDHE